MEMACTRVSLAVVVLFCTIGLAFGCFGLHYVQNTPIVTLQTNQQYSVSFMFEHDNPGGTYTCFLRDGESCPPVTNNTDCDEGQNITFTNLNPGVWFNCGVRCRFGNTLRTISRSFATPSQPVDCNAMLINDGISFLNYTMEGNATTCFMWSSSGSPSGFECRIDDGTPFDCDSPLYRVLDVDQHTINIRPLGCPGTARALRRRFEVQPEGCALPISVN